MNTLLDAANTKKLSASCKDALGRASAETPIHALLRLATVSPGSPLGLSPEPIDDAIRSAGHTFGQGRQLLQDLKDELDMSAKSLSSWLDTYTPLWLVDATAVQLPAVELAKLSHHPDVRQIDLQPVLTPARRISEVMGDRPAETPARGLHLDLMGSKPLIALIDGAPLSHEPQDFAGACFDPAGRPRPGRDVGDAMGEAWYDTLRELIPDARWLRASVFDQNGNATFAQVIAGLQWSLERGTDLVLLDLGEAAFDPVWHLPLLRCTLNGTSVLVAGAERSDKEREMWPVHVPLAGCYNRGPLRTDLLVSGAPLGSHRLTGSLAATTRTAAAVILLQTVAPRLKNDPAALVGPLFAGPRNGLAPGGVELDEESMLKAISPAA